MRKDITDEVRFIAKAKKDFLIMKNRFLYSGCICPELFFPEKQQFSEQN